MLSKYAILLYEKPIADAYADAEALLVENIAKHIGTGHAWNTARWEMEKLSEMGRLTEENAKIINKALASVPANLKKALTGAALDSYSYIEQQAHMAEVLKATITDPEGIAGDIILDYYNQAWDKLNLTNTTMLDSSRYAFLQAVQDTLYYNNQIISDAQRKAAYSAFNAATAGVLTGGTTTVQATERAIRKLADQGLTGFVDSAGRHWTPEAYASMVVRSSVHNASVESVKTYMQTAGSNVFQCSWHPASRPTHYPFQGKFYSWDNVPGVFVDGAGNRHTVRPVSEAGYGTPAGLFGVNCGHTAFAMVPGVSMPVSLKDMPSEKENNARYAILQDQRAMERQVRACKTRAAAFMAAGNDEAAKKEQEKLWLAQHKLSQFVRDNNLTRDYDRERVYTGGKQIRGIKPQGGTPSPQAPVTPTSAFSSADPKTTLASAAAKSGVPYKPVDVYTNTPSMDDIIVRLAGGDLTDGSCSSLAFAYLANRNGYDVIDYRGGSSQKFYSRNSNIYAVPKEVPGAVAWFEKNYSDLKAAAEIFKRVEAGKEYYFATGRHAAVIRLSPDTGKLQYLEMQSGSNVYLNGWHDLDEYGTINKTLRGRFKAKQSHTTYGIKYETTTILIDGETLKGDEYRDLMGYINNDEDKQKKGSGGYAK